MGNGNCNKCKCDNCDNGEQNIKNDNNVDKNLEIIKNDSYQSFDNEINKLKLQTINNENNDNKGVQISKNLENEKHTTNNNQEQITDNKKEKIENDNNYSINNNEKNDTANYININCNDKENKNEKEMIKQYKENIDDVIEKEKTINNKNIANINNIYDINDNYRKSLSNTAINEIKEKIKEKEDKINKTRNNIEEFDIINNDLVYISNKKQNIDVEYNTSSKENQYVNIIYNNNINDNINNRDNYKLKNYYENNCDNNNNNFTNNNKNNNLVNINGLIDIFSVIPKNKLLKLTDNSIICTSKLEKIIKIPEKDKIVYSERFCVLTKKNFSYYKSKECFLKLNKPLLSINLKNITRVEQDKLDDTSYYFGLICVINEDTKNYLDKINTYISVEDNNSEVFLLGFRSKNKDLIIKWIVILNYLLQNYE